MVEVHIVARLHVDKNELLPDNLAICVIPEKNREHLVKEHQQKRKEVENRVKDETIRAGMTTNNGIPAARATDMIIRFQGNRCSLRNLAKTR